MVRGRVQIPNFLLVLAFSFSTLIQFAILGSDSHWPLHHLGFLLFLSFQVSETEYFYKYNKKSIIEVGGWLCYSAYATLEKSNLSMMSFNKEVWIQKLWERGVF